MKILFISNYPSPYRVTFFNLLGSCKDVDLTVVFLQRPEMQTHRDKSWFNTNYNSFQAVFCSKGIRLSKNKIYRPEILKWVKKDFDEVFFGGYSDISFIVAMQYLRRKRKPYTIEVDGGLIKNDNPIVLCIKRFLIGGAKRWVSSGVATDKYLTYYGAEEDKIVHYPFSSMTQEDLRAAVEKKLDKEKCKKRIGLTASQCVLFVGQFIYRKGIDILLEAANMLPNNIYFVLVGDNPSEKVLDYCKEKNMVNVEFPGFKTKTELADYYAAADLFVLPTREDIWGLVINEAMAYGLPIVTTDKCVSGVELVKNGENGYIVPIDDPTALAEAIQKSLQNNVEMGDVSLRKIQKYCIENMVKTHVDMLFC